MLLASKPRLFSVGSVFSGQVAVRVVPIDRPFFYRPRVSVGPDCVERPVKQALGPLVRRSVLSESGVNLLGGRDQVLPNTLELTHKFRRRPKKKLQVSVDADTLFDASAKEDLKLGRDVQMVGLDLKNGTIRATRLTVYEGNRPVRM